MRGARVAAGGAGGPREAGRTQTSTCRERVCECMVGKGSPPPNIRNGAAGEPPQRRCAWAARAARPPAPRGAPPRRAGDSAGGGRGRGRSAARQVLARLADGAQGARAARARAVVAPAPAVEPPAAPPPPSAPPAAAHPPPAAPRRQRLRRSRCGRAARGAAADRRPCNAPSARPPARPPSCPRRAGSATFALVAASNPDCLATSLAVLWPRLGVALRRDCNYTLAGSGDAVFAFETTGARLPFPLAPPDARGGAGAAGAATRLWATWGAEGGAGGERAAPVEVDGAKFPPDFDGLTRALAVRGAFGGGGGGRRDRGRGRVGAAGAQRPAPPTAAPRRAHPLRCTAPCAAAPAQRMRLPPVAFGTGGWQTDTPGGYLFRRVGASSFEVASPLQTCTFRYRLAAGAFPGFRAEPCTAGDLPDCPRECPPGGGRAWCHGRGSGIRRRLAGRDPCSLNPLPAGHPSPSHPTLRPPPPLPTRPHRLRPRH
jgi:hypothetical protein